MSGTRALTRAAGLAAMLTVAALSLATPAGAASSSTAGTALRLDAPEPHVASQLVPVGFMPAAAAPEAAEPSSAPPVMRSAGVALLVVGLLAMGSGCRHRLVLAVQTTARRRSVGVASAIAAVLMGGIYSTSAAVAPTPLTVHLSPAPTSVDHATACAVPDVPTTPRSVGGTFVSFTLVSATCRS